MLWGLAEDPFTRAEVAAAHDAAVEAALSFFARHGSVTRRGTDGVDQVDTRGLSVALFRQHTSRSSDPQLHTHAIVVAKVQDHSGRWLSLDARFLKRQQCSIGWIYAAALRSELSARLGVRWGPVTNGHADIEGVPAEALRVFSARAAQVKQRLGVLVARWVEGHDGAEPDPRTLYRLERRAAVDSRPAKHAVGDPEALRADWRAQGAAAGVESIDVLATSPGLPGLDGVDRAGIVAEALARVAAESSTWLRADLSRHIATLLPAGATATGAEAVGLVEELTALAAGACVELQPEAPAGVARRRDGRPVSEAVTRHLTTAAVLDQEARLLVWAAGAATGPLPLSDGDDAQAAAAEAVAGAERLVLLVGPAGTGKTTVLGVAARSLAAQGRPVVGLAPSGKAADVLAVETAWQATTLAKLLTDAARPGYRPPPAGTTVVLDEAGMAATDDLDALVGLVGRHGWRLVCVGDPAQLPAVGRGGMFEVVRAGGRPHPRGSAPLRRALAGRGQPGPAPGGALGGAAYAAHGRLDAVHPALLPERVARVHQIRTQAGRSLAITTASAGMARDINLAIQRTNNPGRPGPSVALADGSAAFPGDRVATRRNDRTRTDAGQAVRNRHTWEVEAVGADGSLVVSHPARGRARLSAAYVSRHVELGWAVTGYGTQGDTTDDGICVLEPSSTRSGVYVGMTRGLGQNLGLVVDPTGMADPEDAFAAVIARPPNARTALAVRARLAGDRAVTLPATGPPAPAMTISVPGAGSRTAGPVEPCPAGPDAAGASALALEPDPGAPPAEPADAQDDDDLVARMGRRLRQEEPCRPQPRPPALDRPSRCGCPPGRERPFRAPPRGRGPHHVLQGRPTFPLRSG